MFCVKNTLCTLIFPLQVAERPRDALTHSRLLKVIWNDTRNSV